MHYYNVKYLIKSKTFSVNQINLSKFIHSLRFLSKNPSHLRSPLPPIFGSKVQGTTGQLQLPPVPPIAGKTSNVQEQGERSSKKQGERTKKRVEQYDEMAIVVGKDMATGGFSKQWSERSPLVENETLQNDIQNPEFEGDFDTLPKDAHEASNGTSSKGRSYRKRTYAAMK
nr:hypothetical protein CFP56_68926 [Quercus suber]